MIDYVTSLPQTAQILSITDDSPKIRTFVFDLHLDAQPGQFVMAWLPGIDEKPFSLVGNDPVTLTISRVGPFTEKVFALRAGDHLWLRGPMGHPFSLDAGSPASSIQLPILLVAGGYGVAPLYFLAERARSAGRALTAIVGARTASSIVFARRMAALGAKVIVTTDDGSLGQQGLASEAAGRLLAQAPHQAIYACGPEPMLEALEALALAHQVPAQLSYERYMRCGFGVCGSCSRGGWLICRDGPVRSVGYEPALVRGCPSRSRSGKQR
jgi:dihydroorotate dehydrogenase electron transfer subunit